MTDEDILRRFCAVCHPASQPAIPAAASPAPAAAAARAAAALPQQARLHARQQQPAAAAPPQLASRRSWTSSSSAAAAAIATGPGPAGPAPAPRRRPEHQGVTGRQQLHVSPSTVTGPAPPPVVGPPGGGAVGDAPVRPLAAAAAARTRTTTRTRTRTTTSLRSASSPSTTNFHVPTTRGSLPSRTWGRGRMAPYIGFEGSRARRSSLLLFSASLRLSPVSLSLREGNLRCLTNKSLESNDSLSLSLSRLSLSLRARRLFRRGAATGQSHLQSSADGMEKFWSSSSSSFTSSDPSNVYAAVRRLVCELRRLQPANVTDHPTRTREQGRAELRTAQHRHGCEGTFFWRGTRGAPDAVAPDAVGLRIAAASNGCRSIKVGDMLVDQSGQKHKVEKVRKRKLCYGGWGGWATTD